MRIPLTSKPQTFQDRAMAAGDQALEFVRSVPERLDTSRKRALAVAGGAVSAAAGFAFWRAKKDDRPSSHIDPAQPVTPWKMSQSQPVEGAGSQKPVDQVAHDAGVKAAAAETPSRSK